jgi:hypothetical protein
MDIDGRTVYHIPRKKFVKHIRHSLGTTLTDIQKGNNLRLEINLANNTVYDIIVVSENSMWENWLYKNNVIV